jgi:hypothetical protein
MNKSPSYAVRATFAAPTALPAAGAYDTAGAATKLDAPGATRAEVFVQYTRGAAGGAFKVKLLVSDDGTNFFERTVVDTAVSGASNVFTQEFKFPVAAGAPAELRTLLLDVGMCVAFKLLFAEYGVAGTPGTLSATCRMIG